MNRRVSVRWYLIGANGAALLLPLLAGVGLRVYDVYLMRQTERQLMAQAVVIGEAFRLAHMGEQDPSTVLWSHLGNLDEVQVRPKDRWESRYTPYDPQTDLGSNVLSPQPKPGPCSHVVDPALQMAALAVQPLLERSQVFNLSAMRILDPKGCVMASTRSELHTSLAGLPEVEEALSGRYAAAARERISDEPDPPIWSMRRRGKVRIFSALPILHNGEVLGVVRVSRTSISATESLWQNRRGFVWAAVVTFSLVVVVSLAFSLAISRPLRRLQSRAEAVTAGGAGVTFEAGAVEPEEISALGEAFERMTRELTERAQYAKRYTAHVTHELKTPITAIRGAAELLQQSWDTMSEEQRTRFLTNIAGDVTRMERLVAGLLDLARIENPEGQNASTKVEVRSFLHQLQERYGDEVSVKILDAPDSVTIDPDHLASVATNLIDNAKEHGDPPVNVRASAQGTRLILEVEDHGTGVSKANRDKIFERFFTTRRDSGGTGLGLAIVKAIAEGRGGSVAHSQSHDRTVFRVVL